MRGQLDVEDFYFMAQPMYTALTRLMVIVLGQHGALKWPNKV